MHHCAVCDIRTEDTELFFISKQGSPKYICKECAEHYTNATESRDPDAAEASLNEIYGKIKSSHDLAVLEMLSETLRDAKRRIDAIRDGSYDFSLDSDEGEDQLLEVPEELRQDPEEALEEAKMEEEAKKVTAFDHVLNWIWIAIAVFGIGYLGYMIATLFL